MDALDWIDEDRVKGVKKKAKERKENVYPSHKNRPSGACAFSFSSFSFVRISRLEILNVRLKSLSVVKSTERYNMTETSCSFANVDGFKCHSVRYSYCLLN